MAGIFAVPAMAQTVSSAEVVERIVKGSHGNIEIDIPENILQQLNKEDNDTRRGGGQAVIKPGINKLQGYRIQVFSDGRNQRTLEARAKARGNVIVSKFPKYRGQVYFHSSAPNWYTRIGNFRTQEEASSALVELKRAFPNLSNEMRIVKSQIVIIR